MSDVINCQLFLKKHHSEVVAGGDAVQRCRELMSRILDSVGLLWDQVEMAKKNVFDNSLTEDVWRALNEITDGESCASAGLTVQEAKTICPDAGLRERQKLAANRFSLQETIEATVQRSHFTKTVFSLILRKNHLD